MRRMVLIALMAFCGLLFLGEEKASAIPYTFTWDVSGSMIGQALGPSDWSSWDAAFFIESTDLGWSGAWGCRGTIPNASGDTAYNINFFNAVSGDISDGFGSDAYSQTNPVSAMDFVSDGIMAAESSALTDVLNVKGSVSLNPRLRKPI